MRSRAISKRKINWENGKAVVVKLNRGRPRKPLIFLVKDNLQNWPDDLRVGGVWLQHLINVKFRHEDDDTYAGWSILNFAVLKEQFGRDANGKWVASRVINRAVVEGLIERDGDWRKWKKSYGYRFCPRWENKPTLMLSSATLAEHAALAKPLKAVEQKVASAKRDNERNFHFNAVHRAMAKAMNEFTASPAAYAAAAALPEAQARNVTHMLNTLAAQSDLPHPDPRGRWYSAIVFMPGTIRRLLTINGRPVVEIDIRQSQPNCLWMAYARHKLAALAAAREYTLAGSLPSRSTLSTTTSTSPSTNRSGGGNGKGGGKAGSNPTSNFNTISLTKKGAALPKTAVSAGNSGTYAPMNSVALDGQIRGQNGVEKHPFLEALEAGELYEKLMEAVSWKKDERDAFKTEWNTWINGKLGAAVDVDRAMAKLFPDIRVFVVEAKARGDALWESLHEMEAALMYGEIAPALQAMGVVFATVHDSVLCAVDDVETVKGVIKAVYLRHGVKVPVNVKTKERDCERGTPRAAARSAATGHVPLWALPPAQRIQRIKAELRALPDDATGQMHGLFGKLTRAKLDAKIDKLFDGRSDAEVDRVCAERAAIWRYVCRATTITKAIRQEILAGDDPTWELAKLQQRKANAKLIREAVWADGLAGVLALKGMVWYDSDKPTDWHETLFAGYKRKFCLSGRKLRVLVNAA